MNKKLSIILSSIDASNSIIVKRDSEEFGTVSCDGIAEFKELRGLIKQAIADETMRCAAEIEGLPTIRESDKPFKDFAVNVLRGMKIF